MIVATHCEYPKALIFVAMIGNGRNLCKLTGQGCIGMGYMNTSQL